VIADHLRALSFAIADGAQPSNTDRGYVLRKILRRAVRYGRQLNGIEQPFMADLLPSLIEVMGDDYPELRTSQTRIAELLTVEEESFQRVLKRGKHLLSAVMDRSKKKGTISGDDAFTLKDTYGFPLDEISLIAKDAELTVDETRYAKLEEEARERSRAAHEATHEVADTSLFADQTATEFTGYESHTEETTITGIVVDDNLVDRLEKGQKGLILLAKTPFYAEKGGQVGDTGAITTNGSLFAVQNTQTPYPDIAAHVGICEEGSFAVGDRVLATIDGERRQQIANNHTATHLVHWALQRILGDHVRQAGSVVDANRLRFDFNHHKAITQEQIREIEDLVNEKIRHNRPVESYELSYSEVQKRNDIKQFFGDKYGAKVRVVDIDYSRELCGGTHTASTGTIGLCKIAKESSIAAGVRRLEVVTGHAAEMLARESEDLLASLAENLKTPVSKIDTRLEKLLEENQELKSSLKELNKASRGAVLTNLLSQISPIGDLQLLSSVIDVPSKELRTFADEAFGRLQNGILILGVADGERCQLLARCSPAAIERGIEAKKIISEIAEMVQGRGGGKADSAQAGGSDPSQLQAAIAQGAKWVESQ
jgi:alanyl-tRNA synthetase